MTIELLYFDGCPHVDEARRNLRDALAVIGGGLTWREWNSRSASTPDEYRRYPSPTVLVDGHDVAGSAPQASAMACRADGAPSTERILESLRSS